MKQKKLYVTEANKDLINSMCEAAHKRCDNHLLDYDKIKKGLEAIEWKCAMLLGRHKKYMYYSLCTNQEKAKAYKYRYGADRALLKWDAKGWYIVTIKREQFWPSDGNNSAPFFKIPEDEKQEILSEIKEHLFNKFFN